MSSNHNHEDVGVTKPKGQCLVCDGYWTNAKNPNPIEDELQDMARIIQLSCSTKMKPETAMHYAQNLQKAGYGRLPVPVPVPEVPAVNHREALQEMLDLEERDIRIRDWALEYLTDDEKQQRYEGFKRRAETTQEAIERHQQKRAVAVLRADALIAAINKFPEGEQ